MFTAPKSHLTGGPKKPVKGYMPTFQDNGSRPSRVNGLSQGRVSSNHHAKRVEKIINYGG